VRARNNLGVVLANEREGTRKTRSKDLDLYDSYYEGTQYSKLPRWDDAHDKSGEFIPVRHRQPRIVYPFTKVLVDRIAAKLVGSEFFPNLKVEDDPDTSEFIRMIIKASKLKREIITTMKLMGLSGSSFLRFSVIEGSLVLETFHANYCYPVFSASGKLESVSIKYVYEDHNDRDPSGNLKKKWYRLDLTKTSDILYDNPDYNYEANPEFNVVSQVDHNFGFVQGTWFRTGMEKFNPDGPSLVCDVLDFIDELNYNISQSSMAVGYGQEPQLAFSGVETEDLDKLIKSSSKAWHLGKDGKAMFLQNDLNGVKVASEFRDKIRLGIQDVARVVLLDPEKFAAHAQSGRAMEIMHGPMIELISELRPFVEDGIIEIITKMAVAVLKLTAMGLETDIIIPPGYQPQSMNITPHWPPLFPMTLDDLQKKSDIAIKLSAARVMSEEWATGYMAGDVGVEDVEEERAKIEAQPVANPFGGAFLNMGGDPSQPQDPNQPGEQPNAE
jgi:hypothetical protein